MKKRKIPLRKCVVSGEMKTKKEMVRIVRSKDGEVAIDPTGKMPGRGAYISIEPDIVKKAQERDVLNRVLNGAVPTELYEELLEYVTHQKARQELLGN